MIHNNLFFIGCVSGGGGSYVAERAVLVEVLDVVCGTDVSYKVWYGTTIKNGWKLWVWGEIVKITSAMLPSPILCAIRGFKGARR